MIHYDINIDPKSWGNHFWHTMEAIACTLNPKNKDYIYSFFDNLRFVIPCENCRHHYNVYFKDYKIKKYMENSLTLLMWLFKLKVIIKKRQGLKNNLLFNDYVKYIIDKFDVPEIQYHMDKNDELKAMIKNQKFEKKYHLKEFFDLIKNE